MDNINIDDLVIWLAPFYPPPGWMEYWLLLFAIAGCIGLIYVALVIVIPLLTYFFLKKRTN